MATIIAHRGFSSRQPEMTRAAYQAAIDLSAETGLEIAVECDVHFSADDQLICLHDLTIDRTSTRTGLAHDFTVAQLKRIDFGSRRVRRPTSDQRELVTLQELLEMVRDARAAGVPVSVVIETKHPNPCGLRIEERVAEQLHAFGWDVPGSPVRVISFSPEAVARLGELLPGLERTLLIQTEFGRWSDGDLPGGVEVAGPDLRLIKSDPGYVARARAQGHQVHVWTVNSDEDIRQCRDLGVTGFTTDYPDRAVEILQETPPTSPPALTPVRTLPTAERAELTPVSVLPTAAERAEPTEDVAAAS
ncbi:MAG: glycerophosphoryl diester phosphodiesterase [Friedmanniella sp.]|nr:glycerophosphoryl diester phosphodiesterase [Friedmanniella sp.]